MTEERDWEHDKLKFLKALKEMRKELPLVGKGKDGYNYKYAALEGILEEWEPVFDKHGFLVRQYTTAGDNGIYDKVTTKLTHVATGISEVASLTLPVGEDWQKTGAGITYFKRYTLTAIGKQPVGEDFDGLKNQRELEKSSGTDKPEVGRRPVAKAAPKGKAKKSNGSMNETSPTQELESGVHVAIQEFVKDCNNMTSLMDYYKENEQELSNLKKLHPEVHEKCMSIFTKRKIELQDAQ